MFNWMTNCQRITEVVSESMDTSPPLYRRLWIWMHLVMCGHCSEFRQQLDILRAAGCWENGNPGDIDTEGLSDEARQRIKQAIRKGCQ